MVAFIGVSFANGQSDSVVYLDEVEVLGAPLTKYSAGTSLESLPMTGLVGLDDIGKQSTINFKTYGNGQLSTISLRGTSASHTAVIWNGLTVNSPALGQTDFSIWPAFFTYQVAVQKGSSSSLFGSGSIGGNVIIDNSNVREDSLLSVSAAFGSFARYDLGVKLQLNPTENLRLETRFFGSSLANNFPYQFNRSIVRQPHGGIKRLGISQKVSRQFSNHQFFSEIAYVTNDRQIQPTVTSSSRDVLETKSVRGVVSDEIYLGKTIVYASLGYVGEATIYNDSSETSSEQLIGNLSVDFEWGNGFNSKTGVSYMLTEGESENYKRIEKDLQYHFFSSFSFMPLQKLKLTANLREAVHPSKAIFVPSAGGEWMVLDSDVRVFLRGQVSKGYRVPTFNDRFWQPGGNTELLPETSVNQEVGTNVSAERHQFSLTLYHSLVDDWIQWQPIRGVWSPRNIRQVKVKGVEFSTNSKLLESSKAILSWKNGYEYSQSSDERIVEKNQLPYIPRHAFTSGLTFDVDDFEIVARSNFTGERFTTLSNSKQNSIDPFMLFDLRLSKETQTRFGSMQMTFSVNNVFNVSYEILKNTAMPGRNLLTHLTLKF